MEGDGTSALRLKHGSLSALAGQLKTRRAMVTPVITHPDEEDGAPAYEVIYERPGGVAERHTVTETGLILGRGSDCDISLQEKFVSRQHARIWVEDGQLWIRDLGSSNGIKVNGKRVMGANISEGAELWVGVARLNASPVKGSTVRKARISMREAGGVEQDILHEQNTERLTVLYRASQLLGTVFDDKELHAKLLDLALSSVPGRRGFVIERDAEGRVAILAHRSLGDDQQGPPLSRALIGEALNNGDAVLTLDARNDERFSNSASIVSHEIRSAMCVPLTGRRGICGAIYVDSGERSVRFSEDDLTLLTAIGRLAGVAIENAHLHAQMVEQERMAALGMATANLGHCMKNIVTGFRCGGEFLASGIEGEDFNTVRKGWPHIARCIERIDGLVMNMLTFGRNDRKWNDSRASVPLAVEQAMNTAGPRAAKYGVNLQLNMPATVPSVRGDEQELYRVFLNLVTNAVEACLENGGFVKADIVIAGQHLEVRVKDTGPGISKEVQAQLFAPFFSTKGSAGTGLGLSTARKIVQEHGGSIRVESEPGEGATFIVKLPIVDAAISQFDTPCE